MPKLKILAIDGGGVRGIIPARVMQEIEQRAERPLSELFDYIVGTSTGGILALGVTIPNSQGKPLYTAADGVKFYEELGAQVFPTGWWYNLRQIFTYKYASKPFDKILRDRFGEAMLGDSLTKTLITAYATNLYRPKFFKSWDEDDAKFTMRDVARATSAAPTFFEPATVYTPRYKLTLVDGGVFANNPAMCGLADATQANPTIDLADVLMVSLGTGETEGTLQRQNILQWGALQWMVNLRILHLFMDGSIDAVSYQLHEMLRDGYFYRIQTRLPEALSAMDDSRNLPELAQIAEALVKEQTQTIDNIVKLLTTDEPVSQKHVYERRVRKPAR